MNRKTVALSFLLSGLVLTLGCSRPSASPLPLVQPPGATQPRAPGQRPAPALPDLTWAGRDLQIHSVEYASNGHLEVAHATILLRDGSPRSESLKLACQAVEGALRERPSLSQVDLSVYRADTFLGFGGPPPLLTASVPRSRAREFLQDPVAFERCWSGGDAPAPPTPPAAGATEARESRPVFTGPIDVLERHRRHQLQPDSRPAAAEGLFFHGSPDRRRAALTFDDSPHPLFETLLLDTLKRQGVHATFFCIGRNARVYPFLIRDMVEGGHEVANHTYHHLRLPGLPDAVIHSEIDRASQTLERISGAPITLFRPPGGDYSPAVLDAARTAHLVTTFWTDDPGDFDNVGEELVESRLLRAIRPGGIVLLHDNVLDTIRILPRFLETAQRNGYSFSTAGELLGESAPSSRKP